MENSKIEFGQIQAWAAKTGVFEPPCLSRSGDLPLVPGAWLIEARRPRT